MERESSSPESNGHILNILYLSQLAQPPNVLINNLWQSFSTCFRDTIKYIVLENLGTRRKAVL